MRITKININTPSKERKTNVDNPSKVLSSSYMADVFFTGDKARTVKDSYEKNAYGSINNMQIKTLTITEPRFLERMLSDFDDANFQYVHNSEITKATGYTDCELYLHDNSKVDNAENFGHVFIDYGTSVNSIKKTHSVMLSHYFNEKLTPSYCKNIEADYVCVKNLSKAENILSHSTFLKTGGNSSSIKTNKLLIKHRNEYDSDQFKNTPVHIHSAEVIKENITFLKSQLKTFHWGYEGKENLKNGSADIEFCEIDNLKCDNLVVNRAKLKNVVADTCENIKNSEINILETKSIENIENSKIKKIIVPTDNFICDIDDKSTIDTIEFKNGTGDLIIQNNGQKLPKINLLNGKKSYDLYNITLPALNVEKNLTANSGVHIKQLEVETKDSIVTMLGDSKIDNINFKNGGKVILKNDTYGKHPDINMINVINGQIIKDYPLKGFEKVVGMEDLKQQLRKGVIYPLTKPEIYEGYGKRKAINGFLMYGPPGCGKTHMARMLAEETGRHFVEISMGNIGSDYQNKTVENLRNKFNAAIRNAPSIVFLDEVEAIAPTREGLSAERHEVNERVTELLTQLNNCTEKNVLVICASNEPQKIDRAIKRAGRLDKKFYVAPPDFELRKTIFEEALKDVDRKDKNIDTDVLAEKTKNYIIKEINIVIEDAIDRAIDKRTYVSQNILEEAIYANQPELNDNVVEDYKNKGEIK